jgi:hypothetical protein
LKEVRSRLFPSHVASDAEKAKPVETVVFPSRNLAAKVKAAHAIKA